MPKVKKTYSHGMTKEKVTDAVNTAITELLIVIDSPDVEIVPDGEGNLEFSCKYFGVNASGKVEINETNIVVTVEWPWVPIPGVRKMVEKEMDEIIPKHLA